MAEFDGTTRVRVGSLHDLEIGTAVRIAVGDAKVAVVRAGDDVYAVADRCSHANYSLSAGAVDAEALTIACPKHGAQFSLCTGEALSLPAVAPVMSYAVEISDGDVFVCERSRTTPS